MSPLSLTSVTTGNGTIVLNWSGGRPTYQVQTRTDLTANWINLGAPTTNNVVIIPTSENKAFFRVISDFTARYQVVFNATWSQQTLPTNWQGNAHFSGLVG